MKIKLREYQNKSISEIRSLFISGVNSVLLQSSTGSGKTILAAFMMAGAAERGQKVYFIAHRDYLLSQTSEALKLLGIPHGMISPAYTENNELVQVASIMTIVRRLDRLRPGDLLIIDEAHRSLAGTHMKLIKAWPKARIVGLTASPQRLDGKPLGDVYKSMVEGPSMRWLIDNGFLSDFVIYAPPSPGLDMTGVKRIAGDYDKSETEKRINKPTITGSAVEHYVKLLNGKRAIVFCVSIKHSISVIEQFNAAGIPAAHIDGTFNNVKRRALMADFKAGKLKILSNVELIVEGYDLPVVEGVLLLRPTQSLVFFLQALGRSLRPAPNKKHAIILDHVGACAMHGFPDDEREWSLEGKEAFKNKKQDDLLVRIHQCKKCYYVYENGPENCPSCGEYSPPKIRVIKETDGELQKLNREAIDRAKIDRKREQGKAQTYEELIALGKSRGMKNPKGWAYFIYNSRKKKRA